MHMVIGTTRNGRTISLPTVSSDVAPHLAQLVDEMPAADLFDVFCVAQVLTLRLRRRKLAAPDVMTAIERFVRTLADHPALRAAISGEHVEDASSTFRQLAHGRSLVAREFTD